MEEQSRGAPLDEQRLQDIWLPRGQGWGESCSPQPWGGHGGAGGPRQATALWVQQLRASFILAQPQKKTPPGAGTTSQGPRGRREREELGAVRGAPCPHSLELPPASSRQQCPQSASCVGRVRKLSLSCRTLPPPQLQAPSDLNGQSRAATAEAARCVRGGSGFTGTPCA